VENTEPLHAIRQLRTECTPHLHVMVEQFSGTNFENKNAVLSQGTTARCGTLIQKACT